MSIAFSQDGLAAVTPVGPAFEQEVAEQSETNYIEPIGKFDSNEDSPTAIFNNLVIKNIIIEGNKYVKNDAILNRFPYRIGQKFDDKKSGLAIRNLYGLGCFRQIKIEGEKLDDASMDLYVVVEEKKLLEKLEFEGNKSVRTKKIREKYHLDKLNSIDEETMQQIAIGIKKMYQEENRHAVRVSYKLIPDKENPDKATGIFTIVEGPKSTIKYVNFVGNKKISSRKLRTKIFSRENWLLSFMDGAGNYNDEMLEMDKHRIEYIYRDAGYIMAKVAKTNIEFSKNNKDISITFYIKEGEQFLVRDVHVIGDEIHTEDELLPLVQLEKGAPYCHTKLGKSINRIKELYGEKGYIYCDVYPQIKPDETTHKVDVTLHVERGNKLYVNRINITGNRITRDKVIRRQLDIVEGDLVTTQKLNSSEKSVEYLSFFENESVKWNVHRISDELADLELSVKEAKTGNLNFMLTYGTDQYNPTPSLRGMITVQKGNLFGRGWDIGGSVQADRHRLRKLEANFADPHIFDSDISTALYFYKRWEEFEQWKGLVHTPVQKVIGFDINLGFWLPNIDKRLQLMLDLGIENIRYNDLCVENNRFNSGCNIESLVQHTFDEGTLKWIGLALVKDTRDHKVYPRNGYRISLGARFAPTFINKEFSYVRGDAEASYYTPLIDKFFYYDEPLVLCLHGMLGNITSISPDKPVPYKELYHIGGQTTVRGFTWGGVGPAWVNGDPLGARNALLFNAELRFPLIPDYEMHAHVFYDAGAGWDTPKKGLDPKCIRRDKFDLRHSIGFGFNLVKPVPAKIDWGFKLDRKKWDHESPSEFHLSMNYAW